MSTTRPKTSFKKSSTVKVGFLTLVSLGLLIFALIWLRGRGLSGGPSYTVFFKDVDGMREGAPVQLMGIRVGFVDQVEAINIKNHYRVRVVFTLNKDLPIKIPKASTVSVEQSGLIGEKFVEITPPQLHTIALTTFKQQGESIRPGIPVKFLYNEGLADVGAVERVDQEVDGQLLRHKLFFKITRPGSIMPENPVYQLVQDQTHNTFLRILPREPMVLPSPEPDLFFTVENPMRLKEFLAVQMESAEALKLTNDKINQLLSDQTINTLNSTLKNTEVLTARATEVLDSANHLFQTTGDNIDELVRASRILTDNVTKVSDNLNVVLGNPQLQDDIVSTVHSLEASSKALNDILNDPDLKETLAMTRETAANANSLVAYLKTTAEDKDLQQRLETALTLMNSSLSKLDKIMDGVQDVTDKESDESVQALVKDTREAAKNVKELTNSLNGIVNKPFGLFRLLF